jgi:hypothetical protein
MNAPPGILDAADRDRKDLLCTVLKDDDLGDSVRFNDRRGASRWGIREADQSGRKQIKTSANLAIRSVKQERWTPLGV